MKREKILIVTKKTWNLKNARRLKLKLRDKYDVLIFSKRSDLRYSNLQRIKPKYIFFPHWPWIIPENVCKNFENVVFHMTDLPFGRGGTPLQNLILRKIYKTKISAIKADKNLDSGKVYFKKDFYIGSGSAEEIYKMLSRIIFFEMIPYILKTRLRPRKQKGHIVYFKRRRPEESNIINAKISTLAELFDFIRMLDADGYPRAFIRIKNLKILLSQAKKSGKKITGRFEVFNEEK